MNESVISYFEDQFKSGLAVENIEAVQMVSFSRLDD